MPSLAFSLLLPRRQRAPRSHGGGFWRTTVEPPSLRSAPASGPWALVWQWRGAAGRGCSPGPTGLAAVRRDFHAAARDLTIVPDAGDLVQAIDRACTLREFWHLRAEVYRLVGVQYSQREAEARLQTLNRHFPTRSPRSGLMPL